MKAPLFVHHRSTAVEGGSTAGAAGAVGEADRSGCCVGMSSLQPRSSGLLLKRCSCTTGGSGLPLGSNSDGSAPIAQGRQSVARTHCCACLRRRAARQQRVTRALAGEHSGDAAAPGSRVVRLASSPPGVALLQQCLQLLCSLPGRADGVGQLLNLVGNERVHGSSMLGYGQP